MKRSKMAKMSVKSDLSDDDALESSDSSSSMDIGEPLFYQNIKPRFDVDYNWEVGHEHQSIFNLSNDCVEHMSRYEWKVQSSRAAVPFLVKRLIGDSEEEVEAHFNDCIYWEDGTDPEHVNFSAFCRECNICHDMYSCECQIRAKGQNSKDICWHIHKVHMYNLEYIQKQRPRPLKDVIKADCFRLMKKAKAMSTDNKVKLAQELTSVIKKFNLD